ncbi:outer membrane beta-barrel protein [Spirosoma sp.]|uniref:outer membrane beta-barrel protein n=1 Tax=Spirosoma sp. TaxID=1899569 RepID=UPI00261B53F7|nr:outer membrane beta-barrel protein [Spirosoma sp.]MCX6218463.1 outer membrane beta-barrel protein [Spirosoma sp.]
MKSTYLMIACISILSANLGLGQSTGSQNYFGIKGGFQRVTTDVFISASGNTYSNKGYAPRDAFYTGIFYQQGFGKRFAYRIEANYQQKGYAHYDQNSDVMYQNRFHYVGLTPLIGFYPITNLSLLVGPEVNWLVKNSVYSPYSPTPAGNNRPVEVGLTARVAYRYKWIGLEVGYFNAFNEYLFLPGVDSDTKFKNRTWQAGLFIIPGMLMQRVN